MILLILGRGATRFCQSSEGSTQISLAKKKAYTPRLSNHGFLNPPSVLGSIAHYLNWKIEEHIIIVLK